MGNVYCMVIALHYRKPYIMRTKYKGSARIAQLFEESSENDQNAGRAYSSDNIILCAYKNGEKDGGRNSQVEIEGKQKFDYNSIKKKCFSQKCSSFPQRLHSGHEKVYSSREGYMFVI